MVLDAIVVVFVVVAATNTTTTNKTVLVFSKIYKQNIWLAQNVQVVLTPLNSRFSNCIKIIFTT